jgi:NADH dehydrogenase FAD-containing subunit
MQAKRGDIIDCGHESRAEGRRTRATVVVVGGGYGGSAVAKALDEYHDVVLVEPKEAFMHNVAALRALVEPSWLSRIFLPYDRLLRRGRIVADRAVLVEPHRVVTGSGAEIAADYVVLATGSQYPFPAKTDLVHTREASEQIRETHEALANAHRALLIGAGPVGIELAGEIAHVWPDKSVVLLDRAGEIMRGSYRAELKAELRRQLVELGVEIVLGSPLSEPPPTDPGTLGAFTVATEAGSEIDADIWFRCYGVAPSSDYLGSALAPARDPGGFIEVGPTLQVNGQSSVFALGDVSTADGKQAGFASRQAKIVANNIDALACASAELMSYRPIGTAIAIPLGPAGGAGESPDQDDILGPDVIAMRKGGDMMVGPMTELFGLATAAES